MIMLAKILATVAIVSAMLALVGHQTRDPHPRFFDYRDVLYIAGTIVGFFAALFALIAWIWS